ncbi:MAG TPA: D-alanyl-D-alanine carboxypeptidase/D-alanyl-D-alanine-endopeptidase [Vicinamibacterales bacterium]|nr:D-alanyl-D-alanine carboxypeptidase/D-alanyl-D-alanine-endopeptidase [Vicinamibacterales bacterium]
MARTSIQDLTPALSASQRAPASTDLAADLDEIFADPVVARALVGIRVESLRTGAVVYERNGGKLVVPASNMKLVTMAVAAERLGWDFRYETRLEHTGRIADGTLEGDLIVTGSGDPSIVSQDSGPAAVFNEWTDALLKAGIRRVHGRLIGDDNAFDDDGVGPGWAWDYLTAGYAAPSGALSYNENVVGVAIAPGRNAGEAARIDLVPPANIFEIGNHVTTAAAGSTPRLNLIRLPFTTHLSVRGTIAAGGNTITRAMAVDNPTRFFVEGLAAALAARGITVRDGARDIDDVPEPPGAAGRRLVARRESLPLSFLAGHFMKDSQNFYGEMVLKTLGRGAGRIGSTASGRQAVRETLTAWKVPADAIAMYDGSGLSRYNYVTADAIVIILKRAWEDERLRGRFLALLPVAGRDGTLESRMRNTILNGRVQAKTGTISNVRSLSGYAETRSGEKLVFSMIANHFTASNAAIDGVVEKALVRLVDR